MLLTGTQSVDELNKLFEVFTMNMVMESEFPKVAPAKSKVMLVIFPDALISEAKYKV